MIEHPKRFAVVGLGLGLLSISVLWGDIGSNHHPDHEHAALASSAAYTPPAALPRPPLRQLNRAARGRMPGQSHVQLQDEAKRDALQIRAPPDALLLATAVPANRRLPASDLQPSVPAEDCHCPEYAEWARLNVTAGDGGTVQIPICVHRKNDVVSRVIQRTHLWERGLVDALLEAAAARPGVFVDIGANLGAFTVSIAATGRDVLAIEPMEMNRELLQATLCRTPTLQQRVTIVAVALVEAEQAGATCTLYSAVHNRGNNQLVCGRNQTVAPDGMRIRGKVPTKTLEQVYQEAGAPNIGLLKIDVEGFECQALAGMPELHTRVHAMLAEVTNEGSKKCVEAIRDAGGFKASAPKGTEQGGGEMLLRRV